MQLLTGVENTGMRGIHAVKVDITTGTAKLQWRMDDGDTTFADIPDSSLSVSGSYLVTLSQSTIKAVLTGDATMFIENIQTKGADYT